MKKNSNIEDIKTLYRIRPPQDIRIRDNGTIEIVTINDEPSLTDQTYKEESDANFIIDRFLKTGQFPAGRPGQFADLSSAPDFHEAMEIVAKAHESFDSLPAKVRARFANDPGQLLAFLDDPNNRDEAINLGLIEKPVLQTTNSSAINDDKQNDVKK